MSSSTVLINASLAMAYIATSGSLILYNASILKGVFPYPALLTTGHMLFSGGLSIILVKLGEKNFQLPLPADFVKLPPNMDATAYRTAIVPIAALQGASLWLSNLAYLFIGVSLIQMIKASNTVWTFLWGVPLGLHKYESAKALNLGIISAGVAIAALGAADGSTIGMMIQLLGIIVEAARLAMMQLTLQARGLKLSPITALYYIAPAVIPVLLTVAIFKGEIYQLYQDGWKFPLWMMLTNMMLAFSLNFIGILVIKRMSAVAYVLSGICKDILLVTLGAVLWSEVVTSKQLVGYSIALAGLGYYNYVGKIKGSSNASAAPALSSSKEQSSGDEADEESGATAQLLRAGNKITS